MPNERQQWRRIWCFTSDLYGFYFQNPKDTALQVSILNQLSQNVFEYNFININKTQHILCFEYWIIAQDLLQNH